jgi:cyclopropane-fatty-acyl-phospholipid synthase
MSFSEAQLNKYKNILNMVNPKSSDHLLEIGCGWGGFLEFTGKKNMKITGITISKEQYDYCQKRIKQCQLEHLVDVQLCDYRDINGTFDHAISIEMIEAVGEKYWNSYFKTFKKVLKPEGRFAIQSIIISDKHFNNYRKNTDFIQQYIFPGGMLLSPQSLSKLFKKHHYTILDEIYFGLDYAKTLNIWKNNFNANLEKITELGFSEEFIRLWNFYLGYCEGAFAAKRIDVMQISGKV